jgi:hypothetical protein
MQRCPVQASSTVHSAPTGGWPEPAEGCMGGTSSGMLPEVRRPLTTPR